MTTIQRRVAIAAVPLLAGWTATGVSAADPKPATAAPAPSIAAVPAVPAGEPLPPWTYVNLNEGAGGPAKVDLASVLGKRPVIFVYWIAGLARSERVLMDVQRVVNEVGAAKVALFGVAKPYGGTSDVMQIRSRIQALKVQVPVLLDDTYRLGQQLSVQSAPSIAIVDASGRVRMMNGASLVQSLEYKMTVETALRRVVATGQLGTYGALPRYDPVTELIGKKAPDFEAISIDDGVTRRWSSLISSGKLNVLIFWAVTCPHCQKTLPKINDWFKAHRNDINLVTCARVDSDQMKAKTQEFCRLADFEFTTLADPAFKIADQFNVGATPTILLIRPDGVVDSVVPSTEPDVGAYIDQQKRKILTPSKS